MRSIVLTRILPLLLFAACAGGETGAREADPARTAEAPAAPETSPGPVDTAADPAAAPAPTPTAAPAPQAPAPVADTAVAAATPGRIESKYTTLAAEQCRIVRKYEETGDVTRRCPGVEGYALLMNDFDARMSVDVVTPAGRTQRLGYTSVITTAFSSLGPRAEWRVETAGSRRRVVGLIVRVNAFEDVQNPSRATSYLAVARITPGRICVTDRISPSADANVRAREAADRSAGRPCLTSPG